MPGYSYKINTSIQLLNSYTNSRGFDLAENSPMKNTLVDGLWAWIAGRHIKWLAVEVYDEASGQLIERFDLNYDITEPEDISPKEKQDMQEKNFEEYNQEIMEALSRYDAPPDGVTYRILVGLDKNDAGQDPPDIVGWEETVRKEADHLSKVDKIGLRDGASNVTFASFQVNVAAQDSIGIKRRDKIKKENVDIICTPRS